MISWLCFGFLSPLFLVAICSDYAFSFELTFANASVPIVNSCTHLPALFRKDWHYLHTFGVIIEEGTKVKFELLNPESIGDGQFLVSCQHSGSAKDIVLHFSKTEKFHVIPINVTCVPTVGVLKLCNKTSAQPVVTLSIIDQRDEQQFQHLPIINFKTFETYNGVNQDPEEFLNKTETVDYGFVNTPRVQVLIRYADVEELKINNRFLEGLKILNDAIEKYIEYSGRSSIPIINGPHINMNLEKQVLFLKSEQCYRNFPKDEIKNFTTSLRFATYETNEISKLGERKECVTGPDAYYNRFKIVAVIYFSDDGILPFFPQKFIGYEGLVPVHEIAHHFDLETTDLYINLHEVWPNIYTFLYLSRFQYENISYYYSISNDKDENGFGYKSQNLYDLALPLENFTVGRRIHFLTALFTLDNHDASVFRSYNIRTMNDPDTTNNILRSIAVFIKDQYDVNVVPFIERVIYKGIPWLNITNIYDLVESRNFRMSCFYYPDGIDYPQYHFTEHNIKVVSNLRLCPTVTKYSKKIKITINNTKLIKTKVRVNSLVITVPPTPIEIESNEEVFVFWGAINSTAVVAPTYTFCSSKTNYMCTVTPELLTYDKRNPTPLLPPFQFEIFDVKDRLAAVLQVDVYKKTLLIVTVNSTWSYPNISFKTPFVKISLQKGLDKPVEIYDIKVPITSMEKKSFPLNWKDTLEFKFDNNSVVDGMNRVKILGFTLNDLNTTKFRINKFGIWEDSKPKDRIQKQLTKMLSNDLEYKPYLKNHQHLKDLLHFLQSGAFKKGEEMATHRKVE